MNKEGLIEYMRKKSISDDTTPSNRVFLPMKENSYKKAVYDRYKDDMYNAIEDKALQKSIEAVPLTKAGASPGIKASIVPAGKVIPGIGFAFGATDAVNGYSTADRTFNSPDTVERIANASATVGNGLSLGILPIDKASKGLASLLTGRYYGTLKDIIPSNDALSSITTKGYKPIVDTLENKAKFEKEILIKKEPVIKASEKVKVEVKKRGEIEKVINTSNNDFVITSF